MELVEEFDMASALSWASSASFTRASILEAWSVASSTPSERPMLGQSSSEEVDFLSIDAGDVEDSPPPSLDYRRSMGLCSCCSPAFYLPISIPRYQDHGKNLFHLEL